MLIVLGLWLGAYGKRSSATVENAVPSAGATLTDTVAAPPRRGARSHRVADATSEQAAIWQWTEISGGDGARSLPDSAVGLAQFDLQVTANRRLLTAAIDYHEIDTRAGHVRFHADARYRHGIAGDDFGVQEARADLPREHQREQCRQADHHPGAEGAARSRQL